MNVEHQKKRRGKGKVTKERKKNNNNKTKQNKNTKHHFICFDACNNRVSVVAVPISNIIKYNLSSDSIFVSL